MAKSKRKKKDDNGLAGKIIGVVFLLLLIAGAYYLYSMFRPIEINEANLAGEWKMAGAPVTYYTFNIDGTASSFEKFTGTGEVRNHMEYQYVITSEVSKQTGNDVYTVILDEYQFGRKVPNGRHMEMTINSLSRVQMSILWRGSEFTSMTRTNVF